MPLHPKIYAPLGPLVGHGRKILKSAHRRSGRGHRRGAGIEVQLNVAGAHGHAILLHRFDGIVVGQKFDFRFAVWSPSTVDAELHAENL